MKFCFIKLATISPVNQAIYLVKEPHWGFSEEEEKSVETLSPGPRPGSPSPPEIRKTGVMSKSF